MLARAGTRDGHAAVPALPEVLHVGRIHRPPAGTTGFVLTAAAGIAAGGRQRLGCATAAEESIQRALLELGVALADLQSIYNDNDSLLRSCGSDCSVWFGLQRVHLRC